MIRTHRTALGHIGIDAGGRIGDGHRPLGAVDGDGVGEGIAVFIRGGQGAGERLVLIGGNGAVTGHRGMVAGDRHRGGGLSALAGVIGDGQGDGVGAGHIIDMIDIQTAAHAAVAEIPLIGDKTAILVIGGSGAEMDRNRRVAAHGVIKDSAAVKGKDFRGGGALGTGVVEGGHPNLHQTVVHIDGAVGAAGGRIGDLTHQGAVLIETETGESGVGDGIPFEMGQALDRGGGDRGHRRLVLRRRIHHRHQHLILGLGAAVIHHREDHRIITGGEIFMFHIITGRHLAITEIPRIGGDRAVGVTRTIAVKGDHPRGIGQRSGVDARHRRLIAGWRRGGRIGGRDRGGDGGRGAEIIGDRKAHGIGTGEGEGMGNKLAAINAAVAKIPVIGGDGAVDIMGGRGVEIHRQGDIATDDIDADVTLGKIIAVGVLGRRVENVRRGLGALHPVRVHRGEDKGHGHVVDKDIAIHGHHTRVITDTDQGAVLVQIVGDRAAAVGPLHVNGPHLGGRGLRQCEKNNEKASKGGNSAIVHNRHLFVAARNRPLAGSFRTGTKYHHRLRRRGTAWILYGITSTPWKNIFSSAGLSFFCFFISSATKQFPCQRRIPPYPGPGPAGAPKQGASKMNFFHQQT